MTKYAQIILEIISQSDGHLTAEQIYLECKKRTSGIVLATVYNNLSRLYEQGRIRKVSVEGYPDRYDRTDRHDHLVCAACGRLTDVRLPDLTDLLHSQLREEMISYDLKISYLCPECRARADHQAAGKSL